jgi:hypothetical protein
MGSSAAAETRKQLPGVIEREYLGCLWSAAVYGGVILCAG